MKGALMKELAKVPVDTVIKKAKEKVKDVMVEEAKYVGAKFVNDGINHMANKVNGDVKNEMADIMTMPQQVALEFKKQSSHRSTQPFQRSFNDGFYYNQYDYFNDYYNNQKNRYTSTPQPNLAEILYQKESHVRNRRNADMYNRYKG